MSSHVSPGWTRVEYVRWPRPFPRSMPTPSQAVVSSDVLAVSRVRGANDRLGHGCAVDHLLEGDRELRPAGGSPRECLEHSAAGVERLGLPHLGLALHR